MTDQHWEQQFAKLAKASGMDKLSAEMREQLAQAFAVHQRANPSLLERLIATLSLDSFAQPLPQGARKAGLADSRQLFYICKLGDIALDLTGQAEEAILTGQLFFNGKQPPFEIDIVRDGRSIASTTTSKHNTFRVPITLGRADIQLSSDHHQVILTDVPLELARG